MRAAQAEGNKLKLVPYTSFKNHFQNPSGLALTDLVIVVSKEQGVGWERLLPTLLTPVQAHCLQRMKSEN